MSPAFDAAMKAFRDTTLPYWSGEIGHVFDGYKALPFAFEIPKEVSFGGMPWTAVISARSRGVEFVVGRGCGAV